MSPHSFSLILWSIDVLVVKWPRWPCSNMDRRVQATTTLFMTRWTLAPIVPEDRFTSPRSQHGREPPRPGSPSVQAPHLVLYRLEFRRYRYL